MVKLGEGKAYSCAALFAVCVLTLGAACGSEVDSGTTGLTTVANGSGGADDEPGDEPGDEPAGDEPAGDEPAGDEPAGDEPSDDEPADDEPADDEPSDDEPADDEPADDEPAEGDENNESDPIDADDPTAVCEALVDVLTGCGLPAALGQETCVNELSDAGTDECVGALVDVYNCIGGLECADLAATALGLVTGCGAEADAVPSDCF